MTDGKYKDTRNALSLLVHTYSVMTILFYVALPFLFEFPLFWALGGHVNYYAFIAALAMSGTGWSMVRYCVFYGMLAVEFLYPVLFFVFYFLAVRKKKYLPYVVLAAANFLIMLCSLGAIAVFGDGSFELTPQIVCDVLGNICFCGIYAWLLRVFYQSKTDREQERTAA